MTKVLLDATLNDYKVKLEVHCRVVDIIGNSRVGRYYVEKAIKSGGNLVDMHIAWIDNMSYDESLFESITDTAFVIDNTLGWLTSEMKDRILADKKNYYLVFGSDIEWLKGKEDTDIASMVADEHEAYIYYPYIN